MIRVLLLVIGMITVAAVKAQPLPDSILTDAYRVFHAHGEAATLDDVVAAMDEVEVVFLGEQHDDPVAHYLQAELLRRAYMRQAQAEAGRPMALSLEMFII